MQLFCQIWMGMCLLCCISELAVITAFLFIFEMFGLIVYSCVISDFLFTPRVD